jgi:5-methylthioadenosine/S-adenosylhomocysteine deaminase
VGIFIKNGIIITMNTRDEIIKNGAIFIEGNKIVDVGKSEDIKKKHRIDDTVIDAQGKAVVPGFINAHTHLHQTFLRNLGQDLPLNRWLRKVILPTANIMTEDDFYLSALLGFIENIKSGSTTVLNHHYVHTNKKNIDLVAKAAEEIGVRAILARGCCDQGYLETLIEPKEEIVRECKRLIKNWHNRGGRIQIWPGPLTFWGCSIELWQTLMELAAKHQLGIHAHMNEVQSDVEYSEDKFGKKPFEVLADAGLLGPNLQVAHCVWVSGKEIELISKSDVKVVHNPVANMYLASGIAPIPYMISRGITVCLGTDGPASNNNQDMLTTMKFAACLHKVHSLDASCISAKQVLKMATIDGAKALLMEREVGSLEVGKKADVTIINLRKAHIMPLHDPIGALVYCANINDVDTVIIDGKIIMEDKVIKTVDETWVEERAQHAADRIASKLDKAMQ